MILQRIKNIFVLVCLIWVVFSSFVDLNYAISNLPNKASIFYGTTSLISLIGSCVCIFFIIMAVAHNLKYQKPKPAILTTNPFLSKIEDNNPYRSPSEF